MTSECWKMTPTARMVGWGSDGILVRLEDGMLIPVPWPEELRYISPTDSIEIKFNSLQKGYGIK